MTIVPPLSAMPARAPTEPLTTTEPPFIDAPDVGAGAAVDEHRAGVMSAPIDQPASPITSKSAPSPSVQQK